ncbi:MAG: chromate transporter [Acidobacteria bacterium]|nr:chromate transporter [Acidobacteriota bacterium]
MKVKVRSYQDRLKSGIVNGYHQLRSWVSDQLTPDGATIEWRSLAKAFLKVGFTGFGGGVAVISQLRRLIVRQRRWLSEEEFLDAVSLAQSLPGANAANAITYIGLKLGGIRGALVSLTSFIIPSFLLMIALTIAYSHLTVFPDAQRVFQGFNAAVVGLIAATTAKLGKTALQQQWHLELGVAVAFMLIFTQTTVVEVVLIAGLTGVFIKTYKTHIRRRVRSRFRKERQTSVRTLAAEQQARQQAADMMENPDNLTGDYKVEVSLPAKGSTGKLSVEGERTENEKSDEAKDQGTVTTSAGKTRATGKLNCLALFFVLPLIAWPVFSKLVTIWQLVMIFLRVGTVTFGGGFVMIPQIETDVVEVNRWMDHRTFADGMAFGQITPGPVLITSTFIGYKVAGIAGAIATTIAAFLPSFVMTVIAGASINRFRTNFQVQAFLAGVAPAVVGMLAAAGVSLAKSGLGTPESYGVATLAFLLMLRARLNPVIIIFGCGLLQLLISRGLIGWFHI